MAIMILAHPRSKSNLMAECFHNFIGEIFNLNIVNKETFEIIDNPVPDPTMIHLLWEQDWARRYLLHLEEKIKAAPDAVFKVFFDQVMYSQEAQNFIKKINPKIISIHRKDELSAVKSHLLARYKGFSLREQKPLDRPFVVTPPLFFNSYRVCVALPKLARSLYKIDWATTYEEFNEESFPYREKSPVIKPQHSVESFSLIQNEKEVNEWYAAVSAKLS